MMHIEKEKQMNEKSEFMANQAAQKKFMLDQQRQQNRSQREANT